MMFENTGARFDDHSSLTVKAADTTESFMSTASSTGDTQVCFTGAMVTSLKTEIIQLSFELFAVSFSLAITQHVLLHKTL